MTRRLCLAAMVATVLLAGGCAGQSGMQLVKVPVPVECREPVPNRPAMPTEGAPRPFTLDGHVAALQAEIDVREGYEVELRTSLEACTRPVSPADKSQ